MTVYKTKELCGYREQNYRWVEYRLERGKVAKYKCRRREISDGSGIRLTEDETRIALWSIDDPEIPEWPPPQIQKNAQPALCVFYFSIPGQTDACRRGTVSGVMIIELLSVQSLADSSSGVNDRELLVFVTGFLDERCLKGVENGAEGRC